MNVGRKISSAVVTGFIFAVVIPSSTFAAEKPPLTAVTPPQTTTTSTVSASLQFSLEALDRALERKVPRRLATIDDDGRSCWHRRILGRMVNIDCEYSGYVDRTGPISLRAEDGRLEAAMPLFGAVSGQGIGRFARSAGLSQVSLLPDNLRIDLRQRELENPLWHVIAASRDTGD